MLKTVAKYIVQINIINNLIVLFARLLHRERNKARYSRFREEYNIHPDFRFNGPETNLYGDGKISIGKNSYIGQHSGIQAWKDCSVKIGEHCSISHFVRIYTQNHVADKDFKQSDERQKGDVKIGDHVWIGAFVFITENTTINENAVIGAHSVVTDDIPPHSISVGTPAKVQKFKSYISDSERSRLVDEYWDSLSEKMKKKHAEGGSDA